MLTKFLSANYYFGCFVNLLGFSKRQEGLVHISELKREGRVDQVSEVVSVGQKVRVKVLKISNTTKDGRPQLKVSLTLKDVDQNTGENQRVSVFGQNRDMPNDSNTEYLDIHTSNPTKKTTKFSDYEISELRQMEAVGCLAPSERPVFDTEIGLLPRVDRDNVDLKIKKLLS